LKDQAVTVRGVVTALEPGRGVYLEQPGDGRPGPASRALFVSDDDGRLAGVRPGHDMLLAGTVVETGSDRDTITALAEVRSSTVCAEGAERPLTVVALPLGSRAREALEGMRIRLAGDLAVTDTYSLYRGLLTVSADGALRVPTEDAAPGAAANDLARGNRERSLQLQWPGDDFPVVAAGTRLDAPTGVLGHDGRRQRLLAESRTATPLPPPEPLPPAAPGRLRVVNSNLLNFFNGDGRGGGFPTERGAETPEDFRAQKARTAAALAVLRPDLLAVQELENDGFGPDGAAAELRRLLGDATGADYAVVDPGTPRIGGDVITVGLFYRPDRLEPVGAAQVLDASEFRGLSRQPLAQVFAARDGGGRFLAVVNHLKSKGSCPEDGADRAQGDGQGCWNAARTAAVHAQLPWLRRIAAEAGTDHVLVLGDMNAWRQEDPIRAFRAAGLVDVVERQRGLPQHSYRYFGQAGTLDYAFASPALAARVRDALAWHINADWPRDMAQPEPWLRMSDHDPVVVDLEFSQPSTAD
jgi:predicted extracellular nuclease